MDEDDKEQLLIDFPWLLELDEQEGLGSKGPKAAGSGGAMGDEEEEDGKDEDPEDIKSTSFLRALDKVREALAKETVVEHKDFRTTVQHRGRRHAVTVTTPLLCAGTQPPGPLWPGTWRTRASEGQSPSMAFVWLAFYAAAGAIGLRHISTWRRLTQWALG